MYIFERKISAALFFFPPILVHALHPFHLSDCKMLTAFSASRAHVHRRGCKSLERTTHRGNTVTARRIWVSDRIRNVSWVFHIDDFWRKVSLRTSHVLTFIYRFVFTEKGWMSLLKDWVRIHPTILTVSLSNRSEFKLAYISRQGFLWLNQHHGKPRWHDL